MLQGQIEDRDTTTHRGPGALATRLKPPGSPQINVPLVLRPPASLTTSASTPSLAIVPSVPRPMTSRPQPETPERRHLRNQVQHLEQEVYQTRAYAQQLAQQALQAQSEH